MPCEWYTLGCATGKAQVGTYKQSYILLLLKLPSKYLKFTIAFLTAKAILNAWMVFNTHQASIKTKMIGMFFNSSRESHSLNIRFKSTWDVI